MNAIPPAPPASPAPPIPRRAFTLIELLVVISIIAVLIAMLLPTLKESREMALSLQCAASIRGIAVAGCAYTLDNKEKMPYGMYMEYIAGQAQPANCYTWDDLMDSYLGAISTPRSSRPIRSRPTKNSRPSSAPKT
jgi:prepilin-type N-terminal cleavage/methylation domain-containing protein